MEIREELKGKSLTQLFKVYRTAAQLGDSTVCDEIEHLIGVNYCLRPHKKLQVIIEDISKLNYDEEVKGRMIAIKTCVADLNDHLDPTRVEYNSIDSVEEVITEIIKRTRHQLLLIKMTP